jgi:hypothetical protein
VSNQIQASVEPKNAYHIILTPITREYIQSLRGKYKGRGLLEALAAEKETEDFL